MEAPFAGFKVGHWEEYTEEEEEEEEEKEVTPSLEEEGMRYLPLSSSPSPYTLLHQELPPFSLPPLATPAVEGLTGIGAEYPRGRIWPSVENT